MRLYTRLALVLAVFLALWQLSDRAQAESSCSPPRLDNGIRLAVELRRDHPLIADATVELAEPAAVFLEYGSADTGWLRTPTSAVAARHQLPVLRLRPRTSYQVRAFALDSEGCPAAASAASLQSGPLPLYLQRDVTDTSGQPTFPLAMFDHRVVDAGIDLNRAWLVAIDASGSIVWYYELPGYMLDPPNPRNTLVVRRLANGDFLYATIQFGFEEITPDGLGIRSVRITNDRAGTAMFVHHDFQELPDGRILFLGGEQLVLSNPIQGGKPSRVLGDGLFVVDPATGNQEQVWSSFNHLNLRERPAHWLGAGTGPFDAWTHANSLSFGPRGNVIVSLRHLDQVISISPDLSRVEWKLGGINSSFVFPDSSDRFWGQHSAEEIAPGRILLFDNGNYRPEGDFSRALELQLDFETMEARKVWEYRPPFNVFSEQVGNVQRLDNGDTVINFGARFDILGAPHLLVEARPDGSLAWQHWSAWQTSRLPRYRAQPLDSLAGEQSVAQPLLP